MIDTDKYEGHIKNTLIYTPVDRMPEIHQVPLAMDEASLNAMASDMLGTENAIAHLLGDDGVMRMRVHTHVQDGSREHNKVATDTLFNGYDTLAYFEGDVVIEMSASFLEVR